MTNLRTRGEKISSPVSLRPRGFSLLEVVVTGSLLAIVAATALPLLSWIIAERRIAGHEQLAQQELANLMERLTLLPADELTPERVEKFTLSEWAQRRLPDPALEIDVAEVTAPRGKRIQAELRWRFNRSPQPRVTRLTAWVYDEGDSP